MDARRKAELLEQLVCMLEDGRRQRCNDIGTVFCTLQEVRL